MELENVYDGYDELVGIEHDQQKRAYLADRPNKFGVRKENIIINRSGKLLEFGKTPFDDPLFADDVDWKELRVQVRVEEDDFGLHFVPFFPYNERFEHNLSMGIISEIEENKYTKEYWSSTRKLRRTDVKAILKNAVEKADNEVLAERREVRYFFQNKAIDLKWKLARKKFYKQAFKLVCTMYGYDTDKKAEDLFSTSNLRTIHPIEIENGLYKLVDNWLEAEIEEHGIRIPAGYGGNSRGTGG